MNFNLDFAVAAFVFLALILFHFLSQRRLDDTRNRIFLFFILLGLTDIGFDIICSKLIGMDHPELVWLTRLVLTLFYLQQALFPYTLYLYVRSLRKGQMWLKGRILNGWLLLPAIMMLLILINVRVNIFFTFDAAGHYQIGPLYLLMYLYAGVYFLLISVYSICYRKEIEIHKFRMIWEYLLIAALCVSIQAVSSGLLLISFGIGLGITVLLFTIQNPNEYIDALTGVLDVRYWNEWIQAHSGGRSQFQVVAVELHQLKRLNSIFGVYFGDRVLVDAANGLKTLAGKDGLTFRLNGNRFLMVTHNMEEYTTLLEKLRVYFRQTFEIQGETLHISAILCGISNAGEVENKEQLQAYMDYLIHLADHANGTVVVEGSRETMDGFARMQEVERYLQTALDEDLFEVAYQPLYSPAAKTWISAECLCRLTHPQLGQIPPSVFIPMAEKSGRMVEVGFLMFRKICRFLKDHPEVLEKLGSIKVNISPMDLLKEGYSRRIMEIIREFELPFSAFQLEITETMATEYTECMFSSIHELAAAGVKLCLDDFGSGYANLNAVLKLPFTSVKLDRSMLDGICEDDQVAKFYQSMVYIMQNMGYLVVAEGVETEQEAELMLRWGVDAIQGYYYSRPLSEEGFLSLLENMTVEGGK